VFVSLCMDVLVLVRGDYYFISVQFGVLSIDYLCGVLCWVVGGGFVILLVILCMDLQF